jgi:hypothetical protein
MRLATVRGVVLAAAVISLAAHSASGQRVRKEDRSCKQLRERIFHPASDTARFDALRDSQGCPNAGPAVLAELWANPPADSAGQWNLAWVSEVWDDQRLLDAVSAAAVNGTNPRPVRIQAMLTLVNMYDHEVLFNIWEHKEVHRTSLGWGFITEGGDGHSGAEPTTKKSREAIFDVFRKMLVSDPDSVLRRAAKEVLTHFNQHL